MGEKQAAVTSQWSPGFNWPNKSPRGEKNAALTQARECGNKDLLALGPSSALPCAPPLKSPFLGEFF